MQIQFSELDNCTKDKKYILACDEVGWGAGCGILAVCGISLLTNQNLNIPDLNDSKKLSEKKREEVREKLLLLAEQKVFTYYIAERSNLQIDTLSPAVALHDAYNEIFDKLNNEETLVIVDGNMKFSIDNYVSLIKADGLIPSVMAASILAKTYRDDIMRREHEQYPQYDWVSNKGYLSAKHLAAIKEYGYSPLHRRSYKVKSLGE